MMRPRSSHVNVVDEWLDCGQPVGDHLIVGRVVHTVGSLVLRRGGAIERLFTMPNL